MMIAPISIINDINMNDLWKSILDCIKTLDIESATKQLSQLSLSFPDILNYRSVSDFCYKIGFEIAEFKGVATLYFILIVGSLTSNINMDAFGPTPEGFTFQEELPFIIDSRISMKYAKNVMNIFDLIVTMGFGVNLKNIGITNRQNSRYYKAYEASSIRISPCNCMPSMFYMCKEFNPFMMKIGPNNQVIMNYEKEEDVFRCFESCCNAILSLSKEDVTMFQHYDNNVEGAVYKTRFNNIFELLIKRTKSMHDPRLELFSIGMSKLCEIFQSIKAHADNLSDNMSPFLSLINGFCSNLLPQFSRDNNDDDSIAENFSKFIEKTLDNIGVIDYDASIIISKI